MLSIVTPETADASKRLIMILLVDNYDSFVFNLARYFHELGEKVEVVRNDAIRVAEARDRHPSHLVISPGPGTPPDAGVCLDLLRELPPSIPVLGVCLGHQCIAEAYGGAVRRAARPAHGVVTPIRHAGDGLFRGLPSPLSVARYHSLLVDPDHLPGELRITATTDRGEIMALAHASRPVWGVQFHPEAILTTGGHRLLGNFLALGRGRQPADGSTDVPAVSELGGSVTIP